MTGELRIEQKIPLGTDDLNTFREWYAQNGRAFRVCHSPRVVNSLYLDSPALDDYRDNLDGVSVRRKLRLRWYGDTVAPTTLRVEIKQKRAGVSSKHVFVTPTPAGFAAHLRRSVRALRAVVPKDLRLDFDQASHPALWNRYRREYLATRDGQRLTVDRELAAADVVHDRLDPKRLRTSSVAGVLELKFAVDGKADMQQIVGSLPLRIGKHSKYVSGMGGVPW